MCFLPHDEDSTCQVGLLPLLRSCTRSAKEAHSLAVAVIGSRGLWPVAPLWALGISDQHLREPSSR